MELNFSSNPAKQFLYIPLFFLVTPLLFTMLIQKPFLTPLFLYLTSTCSLKLHLKLRKAIILHGVRAQVCRRPRVRASATP